MGKITHFDPGNTPSSVVGGDPRPQSGLADQLVGVAAKVADTGYTITSDMETEAAKRRHEALVGMQKVDDTVNGALDTQKFQADADAIYDTAKASSLDISEQRAFLVDTLNNATQNHVDGLRSVARKQNAATDTARIVAEKLRKFDMDAIAEQKQKIHISLDEATNVETNGAARIGSYAALPKYLDDMTARLKKAGYPEVYGDKSEEMLAKARREATYNFFAQTAVHHPEVADQILQDTKGPGVKNLDGDQRRTIDNLVSTNLVGHSVVRMRDTIRAGIDQVGELAERVMSGKREPELLMQYIENAKTEIALSEGGQRRNADGSISKISDEEKKFNIDAATRKLEALTALQQISDLASNYQVGNTPAVGNDLANRQDEILNKHGAKIKLKEHQGLLEVLTHERNILAAMKAGDIADSQGRAWLAELNRARPQAVKESADATGTFLTFGLPWQDARQVGTVELNKLFTGALRTAPMEQQVAARSKYVMDMLEASKSGNPTKGDAQRIAGQAAYLSVRKPIPPAYQKGTK